tara:strand:- start:72 stop:191 length:120 start_codon:yes stop_codon:yes gene_type:complete
MPMGPGTYGSKRGRPPKRDVKKVTKKMNAKTAKKKKKKK